MKKTLFGQSLRTDEDNHCFTNRNFVDVCTVIPLIRFEVVCLRLKLVG